MPPLGATKLFSTALMLAVPPWLMPSTFPWSSSSVNPTALLLRAEATTVALSRALSWNE